MCNLVIECLEKKSKRAKNTQTIWIDRWGYESRDFLDKGLFGERVLERKVGDVPRCEGESYPGIGGVRCTVHKGWSPCTLQVCSSTIHGYTR